VDRPHRDARLRKIDDELREAGVAIFSGISGAHERDQVVHAMRVRCPNLAAVDHPAAVCRTAGAYRGEVGPGIRLAHADAEEAFAATDARQDVALRAIAAVTQDLRAGLTVRDPVLRRTARRRRAFPR
jgi:hypothetical protein